MTKQRRMPCSDCGEMFFTSAMRQKVQLYSRTDSGEGSLTDVKFMKRLGDWLCDGCVFKQEQGIVTVQEAFL